MEAKIKANHKLNKRISGNDKYHKGNQTAIGWSADGIRCGGQRGFVRRRHWDLQLCGEQEPCQVLGKGLQQRQQPEPRWEAGQDGALQEWSESWGGHKDKGGRGEGQEKELEKWRKARSAGGLSEHGKGLGLPSCEKGSSQKLLKVSQGMVVM